MHNSYYTSLLRVIIIVTFLCTFHTHALQKKEYFQEIPDGDTMIVITTEKYKDAVKPLVEWKNRRGLVTSLFVYPDETGGEGKEFLKQFIQDQYDSLHLTYILFVGDNEDIPSLQGGGGVSDPLYVYLAGDDKFLDACIGRLSVESVEEAETVVQKILRYEMTPDVNGQWYQKATGIASIEGNPTDAEWMDVLRDTLLKYSFTEVDQIYDPNAKKEDLIHALNEGRSWVTYMGHGSRTALGTSRFYASDVDELENSNMLPVIVSMGASNGDFDNGFCLAETFLRAGNKQESKGAIAFYGLSISTPMIQFGTLFQIIIENLTKRKHLCLGNILVNSLNAWLEDTNFSIIAKTMILFGDPSQIVFTRTPKLLQMNHPSQVKTGNNTITVSSQDSIKLCIYSAANGIHIIQNIPSGDTQISFEVSTYDTIHVTGIAMNHAPYIGSMIVDTSTGIKAISDYASHTGASIRLNKDNQRYSVLVDIPGQPASSCEYTVFNLSGATIHNGKLTKTSDHTYTGTIDAGGCNSIPAGVYLFAVTVKCPGTSPQYIYTQISIL